jgi:hypothetical protein
MGVWYTGWMQDAKKKNIKRISARKGAIPVPKDGIFHHPGDLNARSHYQHACDLLAALGFDQLTDIEGHPFEKSYSGAIGDPKRFSLWSHPAGVFVHMDSYDGRLNSMLVEMEFNCGYSREHHKRAGYPPGSGGSYINMDGTHAWDRSFDVAGFSSMSFLHLLREVQSWARLVPIQEWKRKNKDGLHLSVENYFSFTPDSHDLTMTQEELLVKYADQVSQAQQSLIQRAPSYVRALFEQEFSRDEKTPPLPLHKEDWARAENTLCLYGDVLSHSNTTWPTAAQTELLSAWSDLIISPDKPINLMTPCVNEDGPGGLSLAHGLLVSMHHEGNKQRLLDLLDQTDQTTVAQWASTPDDSGNTLMSHALAWLGSYRHSAGSQLLARALQTQDVIDVMGKLIDRVGTEQVVVSPPHRPALVAVLDLINDPSRTPSGTPLSSAIDQLEKQLGFLDASAQMGLVCVDVKDPEQGRMMEELKARSTLWPGLSPLISLWDSEVLRAKMPQASTSGARRRF